MKIGEDKKIHHYVWVSKHVSTITYMYDYLRYKTKFWTVDNLL